jgi:hypothetical protein
MRNAGPDQVACRLASDARPGPGAESFSNGRIDQLDYASVTDDVATVGQFVSWALAEGPMGLDPDQGS